MPAMYWALCLEKGAHREKDFLASWPSSLSPEPSNLYPIALAFFYHPFLKITIQSSQMKRIRFTLKWGGYFYPLILWKELPEVCAITEMRVFRGLGCLMPQGSGVSSVEWQWSLPESRELLQTTVGWSLLFWGLWWQVTWHRYTAGLTLSEPVLYKPFLLCWAHFCAETSQMQNNCISLC